VQVFCPRTLQCKSFALRLSTSAQAPRPSAPAGGGAAPERQLAFEGPKGRLLQVLKTCSVVNLCASALSSPAAVLLSTTGTPTTRLLMMGTVVAFSVSTTAMLHVATKPYVLSIHKVGPTRIAIETVSFLGGRSAREHELAALGPAGESMLFANLSADGHSYYLDPLGVDSDEAVMRQVREAAEMKPS
jgi:hypothetical protein